MQGVQPNAQETLQAQLPPYSLPPAPTFASLGAHSMPFTGTLGSLAQGHQSQQPPAQSSQGLSAAIPPLAYRQAQGPHQQPYLVPAGVPQEKRASKKEDSAFGLILPLHKVKRLIKSENSVKAVSGEASFAIARATELLVEQLVDRAYAKMASEGRESIVYDDVDIVPQTMCLSELIEMAKREDEAEEA